MHPRYSWLFSVSMLWLGWWLPGCSSPQESAATALTSEAPRPLEKKSGRQPFCGVEAAVPMEHPSCGVKDYLERRSPACGAERFRERASLSCPGAISHDVQVMQTSGGCRNSADRPQCPAGYRLVDERKKTGECYTHHGRAGDLYEVRMEYTKEWTVTCERDEVLPSCRLEEFGAEEFHLCRHESHGPASFHACDVPGVSPPQYKECSYYLTPEESRVYVRQQQSLVESQADALLYFKSDMLSLQNNKLGFACLIGKLAEDDAYQSIAERLKKIYAGTFGEKYQALAHGACQNPVILAEPTCPSGDNSGLCRATNSYRAVHRWFEILRQDAQNLLTESYLQQDLSLKESLETLFLKSKTILSPVGQ